MRTRNGKHLEEGSKGNLVELREDDVEIELGFARPSGGLELDLVELLGEQILMRRAADPFVVELNEESDRGKPIRTKRQKGKKPRGHRKERGTFSLRGRSVGT